MTKNLLIIILLLLSIGTKAQNSNTGQKYVHLITEDGIPHRDYEGKIIVSSFEKIVQLINNDVVGYYDILAKDKNKYIPRLQKEKKYLYEDEFQREIPYNPCSGSNSNSDIWWPDYDANKQCFSFRMWHYDAERYLLSQEKGPFHVLIGCREAMYCFTYPKSLVSVKNEKYRDGNRVQMQQDQTLYTCPVSASDAARFPRDVEGRFLWQFKIEKIQARKKRIYGKSTKLQIVYNGNVLVDLTNTFSEKGNTFNHVSTQSYNVSSEPAKWHVCSGCNGKGWGTGINDSRRRTCPTCGGKGKVYY